LSERAKTQKRKQDLGSDPIGKLMFSLAVPAITAQVVNMLYNIVDRIYIGHIPDIGPASIPKKIPTFASVKVI